MPKDFFTCAIYCDRTWLQVHDLLCRINTAIKPVHCGGPVIFDILLNVNKWQEQNQSISLPPNTLWLPRVCVCVALSCKMIQQNVICNHIRFTLILDCCLQFDSSTFHTVNPGKKKMERQGGGEKKLMKDAKTERWEEQRNKLRSRFF